MTNKSDPAQSPRQATADQSTAGPSSLQQGALVPMPVLIAVAGLTTVLTLAGLLLNSVGVPWSAKLAIGSLYLIVIPGFVWSVAMLTNRLFDGHFRTRNALTLGYVTSLTLIMFLIGQSS